MGPERDWSDGDAPAVSNGLGAKPWIWCGALFVFFILGDALVAEKFPVANFIGSGLALSSWVLSL